MPGARHAPTGVNTGWLGAAGLGGAYDKQDFYYLRHRARFPSGAWEAGGMGFGEEVFIKAVPPGSVETAGLSPSAVYAAKPYFAGRLLIFTQAHGATSLDDDKAVRVIVHEFTHAFGYPHKCGYYGWPQPPSFTCAAKKNDLLARWPGLAFRVREIEAGAGLLTTLPAEYGPDRGTG